MRLEGLKHASETAQAKAFFHWLRLSSRAMATGGMIQAWEGADGQKSMSPTRIKNLFVYGGEYCDTTAASRSRVDRIQAQSTSCRASVLTA